MKSAHEVWTKLQITYEGTSQVKEAKIRVLNREYELFAMKEGESIQQMADRLQVITAQLELLGKQYSMKDKLSKILMSLSREWRPKVTAIEEAKDLNKLTVDELVGNLMTHELNLKEEKRETKPTTSKGLSSTYNDVEESDDSDFGPEELAMFVRKFSKALGKGRRLLKSRPSRPRTTTEERRCFKCSSTEHMIADCPLL